MASSSQWSWRTFPTRKGGLNEDYVGIRGLARLGKKKWRRYVTSIVEQLKEALEADYVVLGGGNVHKIKKLPPNTRLGDNRNAFLGGFRLWEKRNNARSGHSLSESVRPL